MSAANAQRIVMTDDELRIDMENVGDEADEAYYECHDGSEQGSDDEESDEDDDDDDDDEDVHIHTSDLLQLIREARVLCAPVSVQQMDQIVRCLADV